MRRLIIIVVALALASIVALIALNWSSGDWTQLSTTFAGVTNSPSGRFAVITITNDGDGAAVLRRYLIEHMGVAPRGQGGSGITNLIIQTRLTGSTHLMIGGARQADLLVPMPAQGDTWAAVLEFTPAGLKTRLGEHLVRRREKWVRSLPLAIRGVPVHHVYQPFHDDGKRHETVIPDSTVER